MILPCLLYAHANECAFSFDYMEIICEQSVFQSRGENWIRLVQTSLFLLISRYVCVCVRERERERERDKKLTDGHVEYR